MKSKHSITVLLVLIASVAFGQSKSFETLQGHFKGEDDVHSFTVGGFLVNLVLKFADDDDVDLSAIKNIGTIRLITIPKHHFANNKLSVEGYKRFIQKEDAYEELIHVSEQGERVTLFMKPLKKDENRYMLLIDEGSDFTAIEFRGYVDLNQFFKDSKKQYSSL